MTFGEIIATARPHTMVSEAGVRFTVEQAIAAIKARPGALVECGVWRGGVCLAMLLEQRAQFGRVVSPVHLLDSFKGLPPATVRDGPAACSWQSHTEAPEYHDNCRVDRAAVDELLGNSGFVAGRDYVIWEGWFRETLPRVAAAVSAIALLRLDCDWYDSVLPCLETLVPLVNPGAPVIIDDYYAWDGCARAVHDFLSLRDHPYRLRALADHSAAYFVKG